MKVVGLTGGIGSGKTTVANMFEALGVPVYIADEEAKKIMQTSKNVKRKLIDLFGESVFINGVLNKPLIASKIFADKKFLIKMNAIIHPKVASHFKRWLKKQNSPYVIKEAAIIFEQQMQSQFDFIITVIAKKEDKIKRLLGREKMTNERIDAIMKSQLSDEEKMKNSDYVIVNETIENTRMQVEKIHSDIIQKIEIL